MLQLGRFFRKIKFKMEIAKIEIKLIDVLKNNDSQEVQFYLFGSYLTDGFYQDIDILIIYDNYEKMNRIKKKINDELSEFFPHITCLTSEEEIELSFIQHTNAKKVTDGADLRSVTSFQ